MQHTVKNQVFGELEIRTSNPNSPSLADVIVNVTVVVVVVVVVVSNEG